MSTGCTIALKLDNDTVLMTTCNNGGDPSEFGDLLLKYYNNKSKVSKLIKCGEIEYLESSIKDSIFNNIYAFRESYNKFLDHALHGKLFGDYAYLFDDTNNKNYRWSYFDNTNDNDITENDLVSYFQL